MTRYGLRPSRPYAVFFAVCCAALVIFGVVQMIRGGEFHWFFVLWVAIGLGMIGMVLWSGFGAGPGRGTPVDVDENDDRPTGVARLIGMTSEPGRTPGAVNIRVSRPVAVAGAVFGVAVLVFGVVRMSGSGNGGFMVLWVVFGLAVIGFNLWSAFARKGSTSVLERRDPL
ncbi:hypothetical protein [Actinoplanes sichuanensis]|uniref:Transmembrane protein n=1 Tax=Actinoplanes sichuanensis TaxID=512349 RepID=A0ABW4A249_9ACTN|nr:hypothetical protein [Actinoplanes sichuanensis]